ncbi:hypothetical protein SAMN05444167_0488 [Terriglobus roseus]|uniref:Uncharacterized protein n=1 Tax=Terriglobus roseus TaxID=392734 RepID=A0A1G7FXR5_9BACT|nr:hypothetical protein SAMN05444167_0488 [Terriglobus roseus]
MYAIDILPSELWRSTYFLSVLFVSERLFVSGEL